MLFKEFPYNGKGKYELLKDFESDKKLKLSHDEKLNDLLNHMLQININERYSWEDYFNHPFYNQDDFGLFKFNFNCKKHSKIITIIVKNAERIFVKIVLKNI